MCLTALTCHALVRSTPSPSHSFLHHKANVCQLERFHTHALQIFEHPDVLPGVQAALGSTTPNSKVEGHSTAATVTLGHHTSPLTSLAVGGETSCVTSSTRAGSGSHRRCYMVWGSSSGSLVFFGALTYKWRSRGVEILPCLVADASAIQQALAVEGGRMNGRGW